MPEEENNEQVKNNNEDGHKKSSWMAMLIIVILIFMLLIGLLSTVFILSIVDQGDKIMDTNKNTTKIDNSSNSGMETIGTLYALDPFTLNLNSQGGNRIIRINISLELNNPQLTQELNKKIPLIRDTIIQVITSQTYESLSTAKGKNILRDAIKNNLNPKLIDGKVRNAYITNIIMQ